MREIQPLTTCEKDIESHLDIIASILAKGVQRMNGFGGKGLVMTDSQSDKSVDFLPRSSMNGHHS